MHRVFKTIVALSFYLLNSLSLSRLRGDYTKYKGGSDGKEKEVWSELRAV